MVTLLKRRAQGVPMRPAFLGPAIVAAVASASMANVPHAGSFHGQ